MLLPVYKIKWHQSPRSTLWELQILHYLPVICTWFLSWRRTVFPGESPLERSSCVCASRNRALVRRRSLRNLCNWSSSVARLARSASSNAPSRRSSSCFSLNNCVRSSCSLSSCASNAAIISHCSHHMNSNSFVTYCFNRVQFHNLTVFFFCLLHICILTIRLQNCTSKLF